MASLLRTVSVMRARRAIFFAISCHSGLSGETSANDLIVARTSATNFALIAAKLSTVEPLVYVEALAAMIAVVISRYQACVSPMQCTHHYFVKLSFLNPCICQKNLTKPCACLSSHHFIRSDC